MLHKLKALAPVAFGLGFASRAGDSSNPQDIAPAARGRDKWIWIANPEPTHNSYIQVRKLFQLSAAPTKAEIKISADSRYKLYVNGRYVGKGPVRSGEGYAYFDTHDVAEILGKGKNVIAILAHHIGESTRSYTPRRPGVICKVEMTVGGQPLEFGTDETWKVRRAAEWTNAGARLNPYLGFQEVYDAAQAADGWTEIRFSEKGWEQAAALGEAPDMPWGELFSRQIPQLREQTIIPRAVAGVYNAPEVARDTPPASIPDMMASSELSPLKAGAVKHPEALTSDSGTAEVRTPRGDRGVAIILDFGREVFGNVEVGIAGSGTGYIDLGYAEALSDGHVKPNVGDTRYTDRILLKKGKLAWQSFEPRAFRYLQVEFRRCSKPVAIDYIRVNQTTYPVEHVGMFECNDRLLNDIWTAGALTTELCMEDALIDTPWRERAQWWGDARVLSRAAYYAFDDTKLLAQGLRQIASSQDKHGAIPGLYPSGEKMASPDFALLWVFSILDYFGFADDTELVRDLYPAVEALLKWFARYENEDGMLENVPGALLIDRADLEREGEVTSLNCLYYQALRVASALASISEKPEAAQEYITKAERLRIVINKFMYVPRRGLYAECRVGGKLVEKFSRQTNIFAALFDIGDQYQKSGILRVLSNGSLPDVATPYFASYYLEALYSIDAHDRALDYIRRKWGDMVKAGSTTLWEKFTADGALCHGSATCPTRDLIAEYVGIKPVLGTHRFSVTPHTADLKWARGSVNTDHGLLTVAWRATRNRLDIDLTIPDGLKVDVYPPGPIDSTISVDGKHWPTRVVTLSGGRRHIRVIAPKASRAPVYDEAVPTLAPHVEVLEHGIRIGRHGTAIEPRKRTRLRRKEKDEQVTAAEEPIVVSFAPEEPAEAEERPKTRGRSRRGGRAKVALAESETAEQAVEPAPEATETESVQKPASEPAAAAEVEAEAPAAKRRRRPRGRGGRGRGTGTPAPESVQEETAGETPEEVSHEAGAEPEPEAAPEAAWEATAPRKRRRSRGRGGRGRSRAPEAANGEAPSAEPEPVESPPEPAEPEQAATPEGEEAAAAKRRRRSRGRGGRGRSRAPEADGAEAASEKPDRESAPTAEVAPVAEASDALPAVEETDQPRPRRRTYRRRTARTESRSENSGENPTAE